ncbi:hypothetical protein C6P45_004583 [Maudiozyma exigua]|uniref:Secreted protein CSS2 C-terminal domain-containing protein n=1 Tax=Maudiozyma exigua TaxID=34358 RepID=A0A9P7B9R8_MAUEX|nr:hypothetical protein C6P45_004583 [Kazachstania exigua]
MYSLNIFLLLLAVNVAASTSSPVSEHSLTTDPSEGDGHDHLLMIDIDNVAFANMRDVNMTAMNCSKYDKVINWPGVYDMVDFGSSIVFENGAVSDLIKRDEQTRDEKALSIVNLIDPHHSAFRGAGNESAIYKRYTGTGGYSDSYYPAVSWKRKFGSLAVNIREFYYTFVSDVIDNVISFISMANPIASDIKGRSTKKNCGFNTRWYNTYNSGGTQVTYLVAISTWTTGKNCDTQASNSVIVDALEALFHEADNEHIVSWCTRFNNSGTWRSDVRFLLWVAKNFSGQNIWDIPCED